MIDYGSYEIDEVIRVKLLNNDLLNFIEKINPETGEICTLNKNGNAVQHYKEAFYRSLRFIVYSNRIFIKGSFHKYFNDGKHNYNDFRVKDLLSVLIDIEEKFNIKPHHFKLKSLEIGINLIIPFDVLAGQDLSILIESCFLHKTKPFEINKNFNGKGAFIQFEHSLYSIKIYDKGRQFSIFGKNLLRFEKHYKKMQELNKLGIYTLIDILNYGLDNFSDELIKEWESILFYDRTIQTDPLRIHANLNYSNPIYWKKLVRNQSNFKYHRSQYRKMQKNSKDIQSKVSDLIQEKVIELTL
jgi:hypothetical protein